MSMIALILVIIAIVLASLHALLWRTVGTYRDPLVLHFAVIIGFIGVLIDGLKLGH